MSATTVNFVERLAEAFEALRPLLVEHRADNFGEILPQLYVADVARFAVDTYAGAHKRSKEVGVAQKALLRRLLAFLEVAYETEGPEVQELLSVSFLEHLPRIAEGDASGIRDWLGPRMKAQLEVIG